MSGPPLHRCVRCGIDVYVAGSACRDCRGVDARIVARLTA